MRFDSSRDVPGGSNRLIVTEPSLKGGRNSLPNVVATTSAQTNNPNVPPSATQRWPKTRSRARLWLRFSQATTKLSVVWAICLIDGRRYRQSAGVTVRDTTREARIDVI